MSGSIVSFGELRLKDEAHVVADVPGGSVHGIVTGIGPDRELILDGDREVTVPWNALILVVSEDS